MGDAEIGPIRLSFNPQLRVEFRGATVTSDAGLLLPRELDKRLGLDALIERHLTDPRTGHNRQFPLPDLFRQSIYSRLAGYEDTNDAERLAEDPRFGCWPLASGGKRAWRSPRRSTGSKTDRYFRSANLSIGGSGVRVNTPPTSSWHGRARQWRSQFDTPHRLADDRDQPPINAGTRRPFRRNHVQMH